MSRDAIGKLPLIGHFIGLVNRIAGPTAAEAEAVEAERRERERVNAIIFAKRKARVLRAASTARI